MKKTYMTPATEVVSVNIKTSILGASDPNESVSVDPGKTEAPSGFESRSQNNVWDWDDED